MLRTAGNCRSRAATATMTQSPSPDQFTTFQSVPPGQYRKTQVGDEQQLTWPTATVWWTIERGDQPAFNKVSDSPIQRRTIAGCGKRGNVSDRRKWQLRHQLKNISVGRRKGVR